MRVLPAGEPWTDALLRSAAVLYNAGATAVWLFGSRARDHADRVSDWDVAVEGLPAGSPAIQRAARELRGRVDIVRLESANPVLRWEIMRHRIFVPHVASGDALPSRPALPDSLAGLRIGAVAQRIRAVAPASVIDFGCGSGWLIAELVADHRYQRLTGVDFDPEALAEARSRVGRASRATGSTRVELREGLITYCDPAFLGHDVATAIEVIEHFEPQQLRAFSSVVFTFVRPVRAIFTTPNIEYNVLWPLRNPRGLRHADHRFEWSRGQFTAWTQSVANIHGYTVHIHPVGDVHPIYGAPTQLAVFDRIG